MNCEQFENLLADALGDELSPTNRRAFEEHVRGCEACRHEYESASAALTAMRSLAAPSSEAKGMDPSVEAGSVYAVPTSMYQFRPPWLPLLRYAAAIGIAFAAGYLFRAERSFPQHAQIEPAIKSHAPTEPATSEPFELRERFANIPRHSFEAALAGAHLQNPSRPDLAKCMIAMFQSHR